MVVDGFALLEGVEEVENKNFHNGDFTEKIDFSQQRSLTVND